MAPILRILSDKQCQRIAGAATHLLERVGVELTETEAREHLHGAGARLDGHRVYIPASLVESALRSAPKSISVYDRYGQLAMEVGGFNYYYGAHVDAFDLLDPFSHKRRPCLAEDVVRHARLIDALPHLSYTTSSSLVADRPAEIADLVSVAACLEHSTKPVLAMPGSRQAVADLRQMAALAAGGEAELRRRPRLIVYAEPVSPLVQPTDSIEKLLYCAEQEIPFVYSGYAAMGGTAPMSPPAIVAQLCAETLAGLVIHQLKRPGAPFVFGGMASIMDMRTTIFSFGAPEFLRGNSLMAEMAHYFELPNFGTAGTSDSQTLDGQAILEATASCLMAGLAGANLIHDVGLLGSATIVIPEMIVATDEIIGLVRHLLAEVTVDDDTLALEVFEDVGPGGEFMTHPYTFDHFRNIWYPALLYRKGDKEWREAESLTFEQQVNARTQELMESHQPQPLMPEIMAAFQKIISRREVDMK
jgi:trimethylamine--corrinoid protein Co-methyltransferase